MARPVLLSKAGECNIRYAPQGVRGIKDSWLHVEVPWRDAMIKKFYHGIQKAVHQFRFKNVEHLLLGSGGNQNLRPSCRRPPTRTFHPP